MRRQHEAAAPALKETSWVYFPLMCIRFPFIHEAAGAAAVSPKGLWACGPEEAHNLRGVFKNPHGQFILQLWHFFC